MKCECGAKLIVLTNPTGSKDYHCTKCDRIYYGFMFPWIKELGV